ncbi:MAG: hypothetical protein U0175_13105 [Caldilineaceae bacterium]
MSSAVETPVGPRNRRWLWAGLLVAVAVTLFFGIRAVRRFTHRPTNEPIREWMNIPYVAHSYGVPPHELANALGLADNGRPDRRPIKEIAKDLGKTSDEVIALLQDAIAKARPPHPPGPKEAPTPRGTG